MSTYTTTAPYDNYSFTSFSKWAQTIGTALSNFGWVKDTSVNGTVNWSTLTYSPYHDPTNSLPAQTTLNFRNAWSNATVTYAAGDVVTSAGATWWCRVGYTTSASSPTPENEIVAGGTQHWVLYVFEVWKSAITPTIYIKFEYGGFSSFTYSPFIRITVGTSDDTNGNLGTGAGQQQSNAQTIPFTTATTIEQNPTYLPCFFSGDSGNRFAMLMWASGEGLGLSTSPSFFCVERSINSSGAYYTTQSGSVTPYFTAIWAGYSQNQAMQSFINTTGTTWIKTSTDSYITTLSADLSHGAAPESGSPASSTGANSSYYIQVPALPIYPLVGWVGNPMTAAMSFKVGDSNTSTGDAPSYFTFTATLYGATRTYFAARYNFTSFTCAGDTNNGLAMRYD